MTSESGTSENKRTEKRHVNSQTQRGGCLFSFACSPIWTEQRTSGVGAKTPTTADSLLRYWEQAQNKLRTREQVERHPPVFAKTPQPQAHPDGWVSGWVVQ